MFRIFFIYLFLKKQFIMKKILITSLLTFAVLFNVNAQQWIDDSSCNNKASAIVNEAITSLANLEHLMAVGMAKAALLVDEDCECANLVIAAAAGNNADWGSRSEKLKQINIKSLSKVEKAWYTLLSTSNENFQEAAKKALDNNPNSALIHWLNTGQDMEKNEAFHKNFLRLQQVRSIQWRMVLQEMVILKKHTKH
jgi:hypothetical protein